MSTKLNFYNLRNKFALLLAVFALLAMGLKTTPVTAQDETPKTPDVPALNVRELEWRDLSTNNPEMTAKVAEIETVSRSTTCTRSAVINQEFLLDEGNLGGGYSRMTEALLQFTTCGKWDLMSVFVNGQMIMPYTYYPKGSYRLYLPMTTYTQTAEIELRFKWRTGTGAVKQKSIKLTHAPADGLDLRCAVGYRYYGGENHELTMRSGVSYSVEIVMMIPKPGAQIEIYGDNQLFMHLDRPFPSRIFEHVIRLNHDEEVTGYELDCGFPLDGDVVFTGMSIPNGNTGGFIALPPAPQN